MSYLQLAEDPYMHLAQNIPLEARDLYVYVPQGYRGATKDLYIREDLLDAMPRNAYAKMMFELEPYQNMGMSSKESRQARRDARKLKRSQKDELKEQKRLAKLERIKSGETGLKTLLTGAKDIVGGIFGTGATDTTDTRGLEGSIEFGNQEPEPTGIAKYKVPLIIGGVALAGFLVYTMTKKK